MEYQEAKKITIKSIILISLVMLCNITILIISNIFTNLPDIVNFFLMLISFYFMCMALYFILPPLVYVFCIIPLARCRVKDNEIKNFKPVRLDTSQDQRIINK